MLLTYNMDFKVLIQSLFSFSPKCRAEYPQPSIPTCYFCYCGKVANPAFDPWLVPHSCGATCGKLLKSCSHSCLLLCHPGNNDFCWLFFKYLLKIKCSVINRTMSAMSANGFCDVSLLQICSKNAKMLLPGLELWEIVQSFTVLRPTSLRIAMSLGRLLTLL